MNEGDELRLKIIRIEPERRRLGLSLKQAQDEEDGVEVDSGPPVESVDETVGSFEEIFEKND